MQKELDGRFEIGREATNGVFRSDGARFFAADSPQPGSKHVEQCKVRIDVGTGELEWTLFDGKNRSSVDRMISYSMSPYNLSGVDDYVHSVRDYGRRGAKAIGRLKNMTNSFRKEQFLSGKNCY